MFRKDLYLGALFYECMHSMEMKNPADSHHAQSGHLLSVLDIALSS